MTLSNKKSGNYFEREVAKRLSEEEFWVYRVPDKINGQPFDIIACKKGRTMAIDCKVCANDSFSKARIEENQHTAMQKFKKCNPMSFCGFYMKLSDKVVAVEYSTLVKHNKQVLNKQDLELIACRQW